MNETFVRALGWQEPLGKQLALGVAGINRGRVIGVVKDFHFRPLHEAIQPIAIVRDAPDFSTTQPASRAFQQRLLVINVAPEGIADTLAHIQSRFNELGPDHPFEFSFLDEDLDRLYVSEQRLMRLNGIFASICILVMCLGLFGLAASATEQRTREIGIRKVLGASALEIILLLSRRVLVLIGAGAVAASLLAWLAMEEWLAEFAYRTAINPAYFLLAALGAGAIALVTIALQSWRTASTDPVDALRYE